MGEVYKVHATPLDRAIAIKLSETESGDRFDREARGDVISIMQKQRGCKLVLA